MGTVFFLFVKINLGTKKSRLRDFFVCLLPPARDDDEQVTV